MACFEATGDVLLFGGQVAGTLAANAWLLQGNTWTQLAGPQPPARGQTAMVYDSARQRLVLFGGSGGGSLQDTWEWNGTSWSNPDPSPKPPVRHGHAMAFDRERGVTVLYGGFGGNGFLQDLWEWNGVVWTQRAAANAPGPRSGSAMAFDPVHRSVLLHGGAVQVSPGTQWVQNDTWSWDGSQWQERYPATPPTHRFGGVAVADLHRRRVVLHGGLTGGPFAWEWDGAEWSPMLQASPSEREGHTMAFDPTRRRVVLHGGSVSGPSMVNDTWQYATSSPADVVGYGAGCAGSAGLPQLGNAPWSLPWLGDTLQVFVDAIPPGGPGALFVSSFVSTAPVALAHLGMPGCDLLVQPDVVEFRPAVAGSAEWTLAVPNAPTLAGIPFYQQAFVTDVAANTLGLVNSNGIVVTPGIR